MISIIVMSCDLFNVALVSSVEARVNGCFGPKRTFRSNIYLEGPVYPVNIKRSKITVKHDKHCKWFSVKCGTLCPLYIGRVPHFLTFSIETKYFTCFL